MESTNPAPPGAPTAKSIVATLAAWRSAAAEKSRGTSDDAIYAAIERELACLGGSGDLLDFGAGTGQLSRRLHRGARFRSITGADLFPRAGDLPPEIRWVQGDLNNPLPLGDGSFDLIVAAEVIEHLENPRAVCRELFRLLRPGGAVVISTPNNESWRALVALLVRGHFVAFGESDYPAHITALLRQDLDHALAECGFVERLFSFSEVGGIPGRPIRTWQSIFGARLGGLRFSDNVLATARRQEQ